MLLYHTNASLLATLALLGASFWCPSVHAFMAAKMNPSRDNVSFEGYKVPIFRHSTYLVASKEGEIDSVPTTAETSVLSQEASEILLVDATGFNASAASTLVGEIRQMRESGTSREKMDLFLDNLVEKATASFPFWTRSKRIARFSRRARLASLRRILDRTTPPLTENESNGEDKIQYMERRRRALVALLRSLSTEEDGEKSSHIPAIIRLERKAIAAEKDDISSLKNRLPEGLETPSYEVLVSGLAGQKNIEIRQYDPYSVCAVSMSKSRPPSQETDAKVQNPEMRGASSFGALAGYLFGKNSKSTAMKMTTPVFTTTTSDATQSSSEDKDEQNRKQMEFVLPSEYWGSLSSAPQPLSESGVILGIKDSEAPSAVLMFGGYASQKEVERRTKELKSALSKDPDWKVAVEDDSDTSAVTVAQYNDPFTVPWKRLNEISVKVAKR